MAKNVNLDTSKAVAEVKKLVAELIVLRGELNKVSQGSISAFQKLADAMNGMKSAITTLNNNVDRLSNIMKTNSKRITKNSNEINRNANLTKTNSKNRRANTKATQENTKALKGSSQARGESTKKVEKESNAYKALVKATRLAEAEARKLTAANKQGSGATSEAISKYQKLQAELNRVNQTVKKTKNAYETLKDKTASAGREAQNMAASFGRNSSAAKQAMSAYQKLNKQLQQSSLNAKKAEGAYDKLSRVTMQAKKHAQNLLATRKKDDAAVKKAIANYTKFKTKLDGVNSSLDKNTQSTKRATKSNKRFGSALKGLVGGFGLLYAIQLLKQIAVAMFNTIKEFDSLNFALKTITKTTFNYVESQTFLINLTKDFGVDLVATAERWIKFLAAAKQSNVTLRDTENIFRSMTKAGAVLGLKTDELRGIYLALEQMLSKGKVTTEELRRQLGERLPGAMGIMAASMGVSIAELDKMMKKGEVLSAEVLPKFAEAVEVAFGIQQVERVETLQSSIGRMSSSWQIFVDKVVNGDSVVSTFLANMFNGAAKLNKILTQQLGSREANFLIDLAGFQAAFIKDFEEGVKKDLGVKEMMVKLQNEIIKLGDSTAGVTGDALDKINDEIRDKTHELLEINDTVEESLKDTALLQFAQRKKVYEKDKKIYDDRIAKIEELQKSVDEAAGTLTPAIFEEEGKTPFNSTRDEFRDAKKNYKDTKNEVEELNKSLETLEINALLSEAAFREVLKLVEVGSGELPDQDPTGLGDRKVKMAKMEPDSNKVLIKMLKEEIRLRQQLAKLEPGVTDDSSEIALSKRVDMHFQNGEDLKKINELEVEDRKKANDTWIINENKKLDENLTAHEGNAEKKKRQQDQNDIQREQNLKKFNLVEEDIEQDSRTNKKKNLEGQVADWEDIMSSHFGALQLMYDGDEAGQLKVLSDKLHNVRKGSNEEKHLLLEVQDLEVKYFNLKLQLQIDVLKRSIKYNTSLEDRKRILGEIAVLEGGKKLKPSEKKDVVDTGDGEGGTIIDENFASEFSEILSQAQEFANEMVNLADSIFQARIDKIDREIDKETEKYDKFLELAKNDEEETKIIERNKAVRLKQLEKEKRKEQKKQAILNKALQINQAISSTAIAVISALAQPGTPTPFAIAMAALVGATGAAQLATIIATPIPQFAEGGTMYQDGKMLINDGGAKEYVERDGKILSTNMSNAIVEGKKGDIIHKNFEDLQKKSILASMIGGGGSMKEQDFNQMFFGIEDSIENGFKKAKINNNVSVLNETNSYRDKMQNWN